MSTWWSRGFVCSRLRRCKEQKEQQGTTYPKIQSNLNFKVHDSARPIKPLKSSQPPIIQPRGWKMWGTISGNTIRSWRSNIVSKHNSRTTQPPPPHQHLQSWWLPVSISILVYLRIIHANHSINHTFLMTAFHVLMHRFKVSSRLGYTPWVLPSKDFGSAELQHPALLIQR